MSIENFKKAKEIESEIHSLRKQKKQFDNSYMSHVTEVKLSMSSRTFVFTPEEHVIEAVKKTILRDIDRRIIELEDEFEKL